MDALLVSLYMGDLSPLSSDWSRQDQDNTVFVISDFQTGGSAPMGTNKVPKS